MVVANMTFEIWRNARSKVREERCSAKKRGRIEHGGELLKPKPAKRDVERKKERKEGNRQKMLGEPFYAETLFTTLNRIECRYREKI